VICLEKQYSDYNGAMTDMAGIANTYALVNHKHNHNAAKTARNYGGAVTHPTGTSEWFLPSFGQWYKMIYPNGLSQQYTYKRLCDSFVGAGGTNMTNTGYYWSSTEFSKYNAWSSYYDGTGSSSHPAKGYSMKVRACLAF
jgi:hypothetical protein